MDIATPLPLADMPSELQMRDWPVRYVRERDKFYVGADIGQSQDPTAVCALQHIIRPTGELIPDIKRKVIRQGFVERFHVRYLSRLPLGMPYPLQVQHIRNLLAREPLDKATFGLDMTGCGRPIFDLFRRTVGVTPHGVLITAGFEVTSPEPYIHHVPKQYLVSQVEARLHSGELQIAAALQDSEALKDELKDFKRKVSAAGRTTWNARDGAHDDLILSVSLALFLALNLPQPVWVEPLP